MNSNRLVRTAHDTTALCVRLSDPSDLGDLKRKSGSIQSGSGILPLILRFKTAA